jgi:hypothetical protein
MLIDVWMLSNSNLLSNIMKNPYLFHLSPPVIVRRNDLEIWRMPYYPNLDMNLDPLRISLSMVLDLIWSDGHPHLTLLNILRVTLTFLRELLLNQRELGLASIAEAINTGIMSVNIPSLPLALLAIILLHILLKKITQTRLMRIYTSKLLMSRNMNSTPSPLTQTT